jgi:hypothetical protein
MYLFEFNEFGSIFRPQAEELSCLEEEDRLAAVSPKSGKVL